MADRQIFFTAEFQHQVTQLSKRYRHLRDDLEPVIEKLKQGEVIGDRLTGVGRLVFKARIRNRDAQRGKSGGYRLVYYLQIETKVVLLSIYSKSDRSDIETREITRYLQIWEGENPE